MELLLSAITTLAFALIFILIQFAYLMIACETHNQDQKTIESRDEVISELLFIIEDHNIDLDNPYLEFFSYLDEEDEDERED